MVFLLELVTRVFGVIFHAAEDLDSAVFDAGELIAVPLALAVGLACFAYRHYRELGAMVAARGAAQRAAEAAERQAEEAQRLG